MTKATKPKPETPAQFSKRTGTNYVYVEVWYGDKTRLAFGMPGCTDEEARTVVNPAVKLSTAKSKLKETYTGSHPYALRDRK